MRELSLFLFGIIVGTQLGYAAASDAPAQVEFDIELEPAGTEPAARSWDALLEPARFTLMHEIAPRLNPPYEVTNNRSSFRVQYERPLLDSFYLQFDSKLTLFWGKDHRAAARGEQMFFENSSRDAYLQFSKGDTSIKLGRQILIWGESDAGAITDVISPRNLSELFFISLEESRISQFMLNVEQFSALGDWGAFYIPDAQYNEYPEPGTAYFIAPLPGAAQLQGGDADLGEYGLRWKKSFGRSDLSVMAARLVDNDVALRHDGYTATGELLFGKVRQRFDMMGLTFNQVLGGLLLTGEIASKSPRVFTTAALQLIAKDVIDTSLRAQYSLTGTRSLSLEAVNNHVRGWDAQLLGTPRNRKSLVLGWNDSFFNENLTVNLLSVYTRPYTSLQHSLFMSYKWSDSVTVGLDTFYLTVRSPQNALYAYRKQSHAVFKILYQF